jgi:hypothetical protein
VKGSYLLSPSFVIQYFLYDHGWCGKYDVGFCDNLWLSSPCFVVDFSSMLWMSAARPSGVHMQHLCGIMDRCC